MNVPPDRGEGAASDRRVSRQRFLGGVASLGGVAAGGAAAAALASASGRPQLNARDREILQFALTLERLQNAFYDAAVKAGRLTGEVRQFVEIVGQEEKAHLDYLVVELGSAAGTASDFSFGDAFTSNASFVKAAVKLEDAGLSAYNGQAENLTRTTLRSVARVVSVEARHAAWIRGIAGLLPAPVANDIPISAATAMDEIKEYLSS